MVCISQYLNFKSLHHWRLNLATFTIEEIKHRTFRSPVGKSSSIILNELTMILQYRRNVQALQFASVRNHVRQTRTQLDCIEQCDKIWQTRSCTTAKEEFIANNSRDEIISAIFPTCVQFAVKVGNVYARPAKPLFPPYTYIIPFYGVLIFRRPFETCMCEKDGRSI